MAPMKYNMVLMKGNMAPMKYNMVLMKDNMAPMKYKVPREGNMELMKTTWRWRCAMLTIARWNTAL